MFAILGLLAGLVTDGVLWLSQSSGAVILFPGLFFGIAISFYFYKKPIYEIITFVILSGVAYFIAYFAASLVGMCAICGLPGDTVLNGTISSSLPGPFHLAVASFIGGIVGAAILSNVFVILAGKTYGRYGLWPLVFWGGILAVIGFVPGLFIGSSYDNNYIQSFYFLFPVWQFGMALVLSFYIKNGKNSEINESDPPFQEQKEASHLERMF